MEVKILDKWMLSLKDPLPEFQKLDDYLEKKVLPKVRPWSEDLREEQFYVNKSWLEFRDELDFHQTTVHIFNSGGEYLKSEEGELSAGRWRYLPSSNKFLILDEKDNEGELFDLAYLDNDFFILRKHGDPRKYGKRVYFMMVHEPLGRRTDWREAIELLYDKSNRSIGFYIILIIGLLLVIGILLLL